jgi:hypothetical protein
METLGQKRDRFTREAAKWVLAVNAIPGFTVRQGECLRSDEQAEINALGSVGRKQLAVQIAGNFPGLAKKILNNAGSGIRNSLHEDGLASDYQLFVNGAWIDDGSSPHWKKIGEMWEKQGPDHAWGGRFNDANHISIAHDGRK